MKNIIKYVAFVALLGSTASIQAQIKTNAIDGATIASENPFLDASSYVDHNNNDGKGLLFPRTDLTQWTFILGALDGFSTFPTAFDGMIVYNSGTGNTLSGQGIVTAVSPGFYYFYNPTGNTDIVDGIWLPFLDKNSLPANTTVSNTLTGANLSTTVNGVTGANVDISSAVAAATSVSNASTGNTASVTVNGITSTGAPIVNSVSNGISGTNLITTVNGIAGTPLNLAPFIASNTSNSLSLSGNTLTSTVNGNIATSNAVSGVSNTLTGSDLTTTVNGVTGAAINIAIPNVTNSIVRKTAAYTILATDHTILCDAATAGFTVTIPSAATSTGREYVIRKTDATNNTLTFSPSIMITEGVAYSSTNIAGATYRIQSDGANWMIID